MNKVKSYAVFSEIPATAIKPRGFLLEFLRRQQSGLTGNPAEQGYPYNTVMWAGRIEDVGYQEFVYRGRRTPVPALNTWWPYEQSAYYLDGAYKLSLLLDDRKLADLYRKNLDFLLAHPNPDGKLGGRAAYDHSSEWPMAVFFKSVVAYVEATGDEKVIQAFHRHYSAMSVEDLSDSFRHINNLEGVLQLYLWTGDEELKAKAVAAYKRHNSLNGLKERYEDELWFDKIASGRRLTMHGVSASESLKLPVLLYIATGDAKYLKAAKSCLERIFLDHEQPCGMPSANEYLSGHDPLQGYETCVITDLTWTMGYFLMADGDARVADKIEQIIYNALPGSITKDFTTLQYLSAVNQVVASPFSNNSHFLRGRAAWRQYRPNHFPECCGGNVHRAMPNFVARMWMAAEDGSPAAVMFGPSVLNWKFNGKKVKIEQETGYPFNEVVNFKFSCDVPVTMPFTFRVPAWCGNASVTLNGGEPMALAAGEFVTLEEKWRTGDVLSLNLPMQVELKRDRQWQWLRRGPLNFSYNVPHTETAESDSRFAPRTFAPAGNWDYALDLTAAAAEKLKAVETGAEGYAFDNPPVELEVPVKRVSNYSDLACDRYTPQVPLYFHTVGGAEKIKLVPMGSTVTRITAFPYLARRESLPVVEVSSAGPFPYNRRLPLAEQVFEPESWNGFEFTDKAACVVQPGENEYHDLIARYRTSGNVMAYMQFRFWADRAGKATLALAVADGCIGWLNGRKLLELEPVMEGETMEPVWFEAKVQQGYNFLKLKVCDWVLPDQYREAWGAKLQVFRER